MMANELYVVDGPLKGRTQRGWMPERYKVPVCKDMEIHRCTDPDPIEWTFDEVYYHRRRFNVQLADARTYFVLASCQILTVDKESEPNPKLYPPAGYWHVEILEKPAPDFLYDFESWWLYMAVKFQCPYVPEIASDLEAKKNIASTVARRMRLLLEPEPNFF